MNEQLIAQLQLLIELAKTGEEFETSCYGNGYSVKFENNLLFYKMNTITSNSKWRLEEETELIDFLSSVISRKPWKPKVGDKVWCWVLYNDGYTECVRYTFSGLDIDFARIAFGNCFRTKEECESHTEIRDKLIAMRKEYE